MHVFLKMLLPCTLSYSQALVCFTVSGGRENDNEHVGIRHIDIAYNEAYLDKVVLLK